MFGIGMTELVVILVVALLVFGPQKLPELARSLGKAMNEFRRASNDLRASFQDAVESPQTQAPHRPGTPAIAPPAPIDQPSLPAVAPAPGPGTAAAAPAEPASASEPAETVAAGAPSSAANG